MKNNISGKVGADIRSACRILFAAIIFCVGIALLAGGFRLILLGGSLYYCAAGLAYLAIGSLMFLRQRLALPATVAVFLATLLWALADTPEIGYWALLPRLTVPAVLCVLGLWGTATLADVGSGARKGSVIGGAGLVLALLVTVFEAFTPHGAIHNESDIATRAKDVVASDDVPDDWVYFGRNAHGTRYVPYTTITPENVRHLKVAWVYHTGRRVTGTGTGVDENTPQQIGNVLYSCTPENKVAAIEGDTGHALWTFDPQAHSAEHVSCRGVGYYDTDKDLTLTAEEQAVDADAPCRQSVIVNTVDARLIALDAHTGKLCPKFGNNGVVDLKSRMGPVENGKRYHPTGIPVIMGHTTVIGGWVRDIVHGEPSGAVRAFDVRTGTQTWTWDVGDPDNANATDPSKTYTLETPNVWTIPTYDRDLNLVYLPTGGGPPDYWGGDRDAVKEKFGAAIVAVDATTGQTKWVFQTVHHDVWDYDIPSQPVLYDVSNAKGERVSALIQTTKTGNIFVVDRRTGKPVTDVVEKSVPLQGAAEGEHLARTQPFSVGMPGIGNKPLTENSMWGVSTFDQLYCRIMFRTSVYEGPFTPPGEKPYIEYPSLLGGMNWGGIAIDEARGLMFVNDMRVPLRMMLVNEKNASHYTISMDEVPGFMGTLRPQVAGPYRGVRIDILQSPLAVPCNTPPFGTMNAIDLHTKKLLWQVPLGTVKDTGPMGLKTHMSVPMGLPTLGGPTATASGVLFFAGTQDYYLRALNSLTGKELWKARLPAGAPAAPLVFRSPKNGKEYVVISAGGMSHSPDVSDEIIAYTLPDGEGE